MYGQRIKKKKKNSKYSTKYLLELNNELSEFSRYKNQHQKSVAFPVMKH